METAITSRKDYLPATIEELNAFILIGKQKLVAQKAKIKAILDTRMAIAAQEAALADAQDMAEILLDAEVRMGEILEAIPQAPPIGFSNGNRKSLPDDITKKQSHQAQTLSKNKDIVEQVKAEARENGEIPTASKVYQIIKDKPKRPFSGPIIKHELVSPEFQAAFNQMYVELKNASAMKWKTTSYKAAAEMMENLLTIVQQLGR